MCKQTIIFHLSVPLHFPPTLECSQEFRIPNFLPWASDLLASPEMRTPVLLQTACFGKSMTSYLTRKKKSHPILKNYTSALLLHFIFLNPTLIPFLLLQYKLLFLPADKRIQTVFFQIKYL